MAKLGKLFLALLTCMPFASVLAAPLQSLELPVGYEQLEYVESTGKQFINTGVIPDGSTTYRIEFKMLNSVRDSAFILGSRKAFKDNAFYLSWQSGSEQPNDGLTFSYGDEISYSHRFESGDVAAEFSGAKGVVNDEEFADFGGAKSITSSFPIYLFALNNAGVVGQSSMVRLYSCEIAQNGTPVRSFVPVSHLGVVGLYDQVSGRFFTPDVKMDALLAGPTLVEKPVRSLPAGYVRREYVSSSGHELLNTEIVPDDTTELYVRLMPHDNADVHMVGSRKSFGSGGQMFGLSNNGGFRMCFGSTNKDSLQSYLGQMVEVAFCSRQFFVKGVKYGDFSNEASFTGVGPMYVFTLNNNGTPHNQFASIDVAELQIIKNGVAQRDFVAATDEVDRPGLYDFVSKSFFTCSQGTLVAGPECIIDTDESLAQADERYEDGILAMTVTRKNGKLAATDITLAYGAEEGGDTAAEWEGCCVAGVFAAGERSAELVAADVPDTARYVRLFTTDGSSQAFAIDTLVGRYASPALPSAYRALEYIRSGSSLRGYFIDTGYVHKQNTRVECVAEVAKGNVSDYTALFGVRNGSTWNSGGYAFFVRDSGNYVPRYSRSGDKVLGAADTFPYDTKVKVVTQGDKAEWYSEPAGEKLGELTTTAKIDDGFNTMAIFDINDFAGAKDFNISGLTAVMKLYSFRMIDDGRVARDFIPCLNEYGEPGLYEARTGEFHGNLSTMGVDFKTDLPTTEAVYTWTGAGASANWTDAANWSCSNPDAAATPGWSSTAVFPTGTWTVNIDRLSVIKVLDLSAADVTLRLSSSDPAERLVVRHDLVFGTVSDPARQGLWFFNGGVRVIGANDRYGLVAASGATELPLHFVVPQDGYAGSPFRVESNRNFRNSVRARVYVEAKSPALKVTATADTKLIYSDYVQTPANVMLEAIPVRDPERPSTFSWSSDTKVLSATIEGQAKGLVILFF